MDHEFCSKKTIGIRSAAPSKCRSSHSGELCGTRALFGLSASPETWWHWTLDQLDDRKNFGPGDPGGRYFIDATLGKLRGGTWKSLEIPSLDSACGSWTMLVWVEVALGHELGLFDMVKQIFTATNR
jgi:hypothetical protein